VASHTGFKDNTYNYSLLDTLPSEGLLAVNITLNAQGYATETFTTQFLVVFMCVGQGV
jgi:hypothetical protein